jgi:hypothetical protein
MIKKIILLSILIALSMFMSFKIYGAYVDTQMLDISTQFSTWELKENAGVYMIESNRVKNSAESIEIQLDTVFKSSNLEFTDTDNDGIYDDPNPYYDFYDAFVMSYGSETSRINLYSSETSTTLIDTHNMTYEAPEVTEFMFLNEGTMLDPDWTVNIAEDIYYSITIVLNETLTSDQRQRIVDVFNNGGYWGSLTPGETYNMIATANVVSVYVDPTNPGDLDLLPTTSGSIFDDVNNMGRVHIDEINSNTIDFTIMYDNIYFLRYTFSENTDLSIFNDSYEAFYYTYENQRFMVFNKGDESLFTTTNWKTQTFIPYTIWNLDTNEIVHYDQISVYMYMTLGDANHIIGYFYVDDFVIDRLMQVSTVFNYRWDPLVGDSSDWMPQAVILEDNSFTEGNTSWQFDAVATSVTTTAVLTAIAASIPGGQPLALGIFIVGSAITGYFNYLADSYPGSLIVGDTKEIELANADPELKNEINQKYSDINPYFSSIDTDTFPLWKLDFGAYDKFGNTPEVDPDSIEVISMTYQTDGTVYTLESDSIKTYAGIDDYLDPYNDSTIFNPYPTEPTTGITLPEGWYWYAGAAVVGYFLINTFKKAKREPGLMILLLAAIAYVLYILGVF